MVYDVIRSSNRSNRMNVRHLVSSVSRWLLSIGSLILVAGLQQPVHASGVDLSKFRRIEPQYIAALGVGKDNGKDVSWRGAMKYCHGLRVDGTCLSGCFSKPHK